MSTRVIQEVLAVCQSEEVLVSSGKGSVPRLCGVLKRHLHRGQKNRGSQAIA